jgi:hypothetical protein
MSILNFPTNPAPGTNYTLGNVTYVWSGSAWLRANSGNQTFNTVTATNTITVGTGTNIIVIGTGTITINGSSVITSATIFNSLAAGTDISINTSTGVAVISDTSTLQTVTDRGNTTTNSIIINNPVNSTSTDTGALVVAGGVGIGGDVRVGGDLYTTNLEIADTIFDSTAVLVNTTGTVVVDSYSANEFRSAKYLIQIDEGSDGTANFEVLEILLLIDNIGTVYATEYGLVTSNGELGEFAADVGVDNRVRLYFTAYDATDKTIKVLRTAMTV